MFDVLPFIPKTSKNEDRKELLGSQQQLITWNVGLSTIRAMDRNNMLKRYATILIDAGFDFEGIRTRD